MTTQELEERAASHIKNQGGLKLLHSVMEKERKGECSMPECARYSALHSYTVCNGEFITNGELAALWNLTKSRASAVLGNMVSAKLIQIIGDRNHRRLITLLH